jgi:hypothetical protein
MVKATKYIVLAAGVIGLIAFFLPLIAVQKSGIEGKLSAFQIVKGIDSAKDVVNDAPTGTVSERAAVKDANGALSAIKGVVLAIFAPALLLAIFGGLGAAKKRFGRGLAIPSMIFGILGLLIWSLLNAAASEGGGGGESVAGIGMHLLLFTGLGGALGGLIATIKPDRNTLRA